MSDAVWSKYRPDEVVGEWGFLWLDGPAGDEWVLVYTVEDDDPDNPEGILVDLVGRADRYGVCDSVAAKQFAGVPYLPMLAPGVVPGEVDMLEVAVRFAPGASATHSLGGGEAERAAFLERLNAALAAVYRGDE